MNHSNALRIFLMLTMIAAIGLILVACGSNNNNTENTTNNANQQNQNDAPANNDVNVEPVVEKSEPVDAVGIYVGQIDNNSVEITVDDIPKAFRLTDEVRDAIAMLNPDDPVSIVYYEEIHKDIEESFKHNILTSISKTDESAVQPAETSELELHIEGNTEKAPAKLALSEEQQYYMYTLDNFVFTSEEPGKDLLYFDNAPEYFARIEKVTGRNAAELKAEAEAYLKSTSDGEILDRTNDQNLDTSFRNAQLYLHLSSPDIEANIIINEVDGEMFRYTVLLPSGVESEGVGPRIYAQLISLRVL